MTDIQDIPGASAAVFKDERVLVVRRGKGAFQGLWSLPGGHVRTGESPEAAAQRELLEESGVRVSKLQPVTELVIPAGVGKRYVLKVFAGRWEAGAIQAGDDADEARWLFPDELSKLRTTDGLAEIVARAEAVIEKL